MPSAVLERAFEYLAGGLTGVPAVGDMLQSLALIALDGAAGLLAGALVLGTLTGMRRVRRVQVRS